MDLYSLAEQFVVEAFEKVDKPTDVFHAQRTAYWVKQLDPQADEVLLIAAVLHDIERAFNGDWKRGSSDPDKLQKHQELSALAAEKFLAGQQANREMIEQVMELIRHHETGGTETENVLCDADCLAYFEEKAMRWARYAKGVGEATEMLQKLEFYFGRFHSAKAREIARPFYEEAVEFLQ